VPIPKRFGALRTTSTRQVNTSRLLFTYPPEDAHWVAWWVGRPGRETEASRAREAVTVLAHDAFRSGFVTGSFKGILTS
jgi:hypothetical protein